MTAFRRVSKVLATTEEGSLWFECPGCEMVHRIMHGAGAGPRWGWNGSKDRPTFTPSVKVTWPANPNAGEELKEWRTERICHSFVTDGRIQFLSDCTHELSGQTVDLPDWDAI